MSTATPRRSTRQSASNTPSSSQATAANTPSRGRVILVNDQIRISPAKRARTTASATPRRTSGRLASTSTSPKKRIQKSSRGARNGTSSSRRGANEDDDDDEEASSESSSDDGILSTIKKKSANATPGKSFVHRNAFDAYFAAASKPSRTSNNVFSELVSPLAPDDYTTLLRNSAAASKNAAEIEQVLKGHEALFPRYALELAEGFNLLFFGFGSKRDMLNRFARSVCAKRGHVVVVNGYMPRVGIKDVLGSIEQVPGLADVPLGTSTGLDAQTRRIYDFFLPPAVRPQYSTATRPLFLIVHNIDSPGLRAPKTKAALSLLALNPRIHVVASVDHVHAQMVWSTAEASARKHTYGENDGTSLTIPPTRGFAWAWHDMTTMLPYDAELAHVDLNRIGKASGEAAAAGAGAGAEHAMTETAAQHILASVNIKAKKLFALLANTQLALSGKSPQKQKQVQQAVSYDALFNAARSEFIATNDTSFKALLAEFRDHSLVMASAGSAGGGETLRIPLRADELQRVVASIVVE